MANKSNEKGNETAQNTGSATNAGATNSGANQSQPGDQKETGDDKGEGEKSATATNEGSKQGTSAEFEAQQRQAFIDAVKQGVKEIFDAYGIKPGMFSATTSPAPSATSLGSNTAANTTSPAIAGAQPLTANAKYEITDRKPGFVYARKGDLQQVFSQTEWNLLGNDKGGWAEIVEVPQEVKDLTQQ